MEKFDTSVVRRGKRKRVSKKNKSAWRKHSDIKDIENFLEDQRRQERTGGLVSEKTNDELFFVDSVTAVHDQQSDSNDAGVSRKSQKLSKQLKCHSSLLPEPSIKPARVKTNAKVGKKNTPKWKKEKLESGTISKKEKQAIEQRAAEKLRKVQLRKTNGAKTQSIVTYDLWGETGCKSVKQDVEEHYEKTCKLKRVQPPPFYHAKPSVVKTVEVAPPGASYNPTYTDHQNLLADALKVEEKRVKEEQRILRALDGKFPTADEAPNEKTWLKEMSCGLANNDDDDDEPVPEFTEEELMRLSNNPAVRREDKKTEKQRKKMIEQKEQKRAAIQAKQDRIKKQEIYRLRSIKRHVKEQEAELTARQATRMLKKEMNKEKPKKLGKLKFEPPTAELKLSNELEGSLRLLKPEGHVLADRFKSLQKRNVIEPRLKARRQRQLKIKEFDKKGHRDVAE